MSRRPSRRSWSARESTVAARRRRHPLLAQRRRDSQVIARDGAGNDRRLASAGGGRPAPNTDDLGLERPGSRPTPADTSTVDDELRTNVEHIWAMGDCNGRGAFTHTSYNDYEIVAANLLDDEPRKVSDRIPTYALYIDPPLGRAGMTVRRGPQVRPQGAGGQAADDQSRPGGGKGRDARVHEGRRRCRDPGDPRRGDPRRRRRRGGPRAFSTSCPPRRPTRRWHAPCTSTRPSASWCRRCWRR